MFQLNLCQHNTTVKWEVFSFVFRVISETFEAKTNLTHMKVRLCGTHILRNITWANYLWSAGNNWSVQLPHRHQYTWTEQVTVHIKQITTEQFTHRVHVLREEPSDQSEDPSVINTASKVLEGNAINSRGKPPLLARTTWICQRVCGRDLLSMVSQSLKAV